MFIGHFGVAFAAKRFTPKTSLGTLFLAAQFVDLLWPIFLLAGIEHVRIDPGNTVVTPFDFYDYPISHSLLSGVIWAVLFGGIYFLRKKDSRASMVLGLCIVSHWILDFASHRPDMPLLPNSTTYYGLGLWNSLYGTIVVELALFLAGVYIYFMATKPRNSTGKFALLGLIAFLIFAWLGNMAGPPPPDEATLAVAANATWLLIFWGYWADKKS